MTKISVSKLKKMYTEPVKYDDADGTNYCVGGAFCRYVNNVVGRHVSVKEKGFPKREELAEAILEVKPVLSQAKADDAASKVIALNDSGKFNEAWEALRKVL